MNTDSKSIATLTPFVHNTFGAIRAVQDETTGEPWFVARDIFKALEYNQGSKAGMLIKHVPDAWKGVKSIYPSKSNQRMVTLSEQGVYFFLARSNKPKALPFQMWLAGEVLPQIRRTGGYIPVKQEDDASSFLARALLVAQRTLDVKNVLLAQQKKTIETMKPKALVFDSHVAPSKNMSITRFARTLYGVNINSIKRDLYNYGYLYKPGKGDGAYRVYAKYRDVQFVEKLDQNTGKIDLFITAKGKILLSQMYKEGKLTMKKSATPTDI